MRGLDNTFLLDKFILTEVLSFIMYPDILYLVMGSTILSEYIHSASFTFIIKSYTSLFLFIILVLAVANTRKVKKN